MINAQSSAQFGYRIRCFLALAITSVLFVLSPTMIFAVEYCNFSSTDYPIEVTSTPKLTETDFQFVAGQKETLDFSVKHNLPISGTQRYRISANRSYGLVSLNNLFELTPRSIEEGNTTIEVALIPKLDAPGIPGNYLTKIGKTDGTYEQTRTVWLESCTNNCDVDRSWSNLCQLGSYKILRDDIFKCSDIQVYQTRGTQTCYAPGCLDKRAPILVKDITISNESSGVMFDGSLKVDISGQISERTVTNGILSLGDITSLMRKDLPTDEQKIFIDGYSSGTKLKNCYLIFNLVNVCEANSCRVTPADPDVPVDEVSFDLCSQASKKILTGSGTSETQFDACVKCFGDGKAIWTAVGCISTKPEGIIEAVVKIGVGIGGGIALLTTLIGGFLITTSQGDPKRTNQGKEMITASVIGILFVLFSVVILQFIGVTIFRLPGFGT